MIKDLLAAFGGAPTLSQAADDFQHMTELARDMAMAASLHYWGGPESPDQRERLSRDDARMNQLQQGIRRRIILHLSSREPVDAPYCLSLMSLVKDVERVGDYAKNLVAIPHMVGQPGTTLQMDDPLVVALRDFATDVEQLATAAPGAYQDANAATIRGLLASGERRAADCGELLRTVAQGDHDAATATRLTLTIRFYKRIQGHFMNLLSSVMMPLDRLDDYEETSELADLAH